MVSDVPAVVWLQLLGPGILPHHCNLMHSEGMVTVTPHGPDADTFVDGQRVTETTVLRSGSTLQFGSAHVFKFVDPMFDQGGKREPAAMMRSRHKSGSVCVNGKPSPFNSLSLLVLPTCLLLCFFAFFFLLFLFISVLFLFIVIPACCSLKFVD